MTVATLHRSVSSVANGVQTTFYFDFAIMDAAHLDVYTINATTGAVVEESAYAIDEGWGDDGGSITFNLDQQPAADIIVLIERNVPVTQLIDYLPGDPFPAETNEDGLDKLTMLIQDISSNSDLSLDRCIVVPKGDPATDLEVDWATVRANKYLKFDDDGNVDTVTGLTGDYSDYVDNFLASEDKFEGTIAIGYYTTSGEWTKAQNFTEALLTGTTGGSGTEWNWDVDDAQTAKVIITGVDVMAAPTNIRAGGTYILRVIQDGSGDRTLTWNAAYKFTDSVAPTLASNPDENTIISFYSDGTYLYGGTFFTGIIDPGGEG